MTTSAKRIDRALAGLKADLETASAPPDQWDEMSRRDWEYLVEAHEALPRLVKVVEFLVTVHGHDDSGHCPLEEVAAMLEEGELGPRGLAS